MSPSNRTKQESLSTSLNTSLSTITSIPNQTLPKKNEPTFKTLTRQRQSILPGNQPHYPLLTKIPLPHIESFNSIFEHGQNQPGLIDLAMKHIGKTVVFDGPQSSLARNKLTSKSTSLGLYLYISMAVKRYCWKTNYRSWKGSTLFDLVSFRMQRKRCILQIQNAR